MNPAEVNVVLPDPEPHGEDGRLGLRALLLVRDGVTPQVGPPPPVARLKESNAEKNETLFGHVRALSQIRVDINKCRQKRTIRCHDSAKHTTHNWQADDKGNPGGK